MEIHLVLKLKNDQAKYLLLMDFMVRLLLVFVFFYFMVFDFMVKVY